MIVLFRVDHRLLHGQVVLSWAQTVGCDAILIANDELVNDEMKKSTLKIAKPQGTKLIFKTIDDSIKALNKGVTDPYHLMILVSNVKDGVKIALAYDKILSINLGGIASKENARKLSNNVYLLPEEEELLWNLLDQKDIEIEMRQVPSEAKKFFKDLSNKK